MDVRVAAPRTLWPHDDVVGLANGFAAETGARIAITEDVAEAVDGCDVLLTDVWVSMGEPAEAWAERIELLTPYQVNAETMALTATPAVKFTHCRPAFPNRDRKVGEQL